MKRTTLGVLAGLATGVALFALPLVPGYLRAVPMGLHMVLVALAMTLVVLAVRCRYCGLPVSMDYRSEEAGWRRYRLKFEAFTGKCARCGHDF